MPLMIGPYSAEDPNSIYQAEGNGPSILLDEAKLEANALHCGVTADHLMEAVHFSHEAEADLVSTYKKLSHYAQKGICSRKTANFEDFIATLRRNGAQREAEDCKYESLGIAGSVDEALRNGESEIHFFVYSKESEQRLQKYVELISAQHPEKKFKIYNRGNCLTSLWYGLRTFFDNFSPSFSNKEIEYVWLGQSYREKLPPPKSYNGPKEAIIDTQYIYYSANGYCFNEVERKGMVGVERNGEFTGYGP